MTKPNDLPTENQDLRAQLEQAARREQELRAQLEQAAHREQEQRTQLALEIARAEMLSGMVEEMRADQEWIKAFPLPLDATPEEQFPIKGFHAFPPDRARPAQLLTLAVLNPAGEPSASLEVGWPIVAKATLIVREPIARMNVSFMIHDAWKKYVSATHTAMVAGTPTSWTPGAYRVQMVFPAGIINCGQYGLRAGLGWMDGTVYDYQAQGLRFEIAVPGEIAPHSIYSHGLLAVIPAYSVEALGEDAA